MQAANLTKRSKSYKLNIIGNDKYVTPFSLPKVIYTEFSIKREPSYLEIFLKANTVESQRRL